MWSKQYAVCVEEYAVYSVWRSMQSMCVEYAVRSVEEYAVCSVCAGGVWRLDDRQRQPPPSSALPATCPAAWPLKHSLILPSFSASVINLTFGQVMSGWKEDKG